MRRLVERMRAGGAALIRDKPIGRLANSRISNRVRAYAVTAPCSSPLQFLHMPARNAINRVSR